MDLTPAERVALYRRTRDPQAMWPGTTDRDRVVGYREMVVATRQILAGHSGSLSAESDVEVRSAGVAGFMSGLGPLLGWWLERGILRAPRPLAALLEEHLSQGRRRSAEMAKRLSRTVRAMADRGIVPTVLKGTHTARRYFEDPGARTTADIDILIRPGETGAAGDALKSLGLQRVSFHTVPYREDWGPVDNPRVHSVDMTHAENPWTIDLHYTLDRLYFPGLVASFGPMQDGFLEPWTGPSGPVTVLRQPWLTAYQALHAAADFPHVPLIRIVELILMLRSDLPTGAVTWDALGRVLRERNLQRLAYPAFALAADLAPGEMDPAFLREISADTTARMRQVVPMVLETPHFSRLSFQVRLVWARGPGEILRNLLDWVYPRGPAITGKDRLRIAWRRLTLVLRGRIGLLPDNREETD